MTFPNKSPLIDSALEAQLSTLLHRLTGDVELICIAGDDARSREMGGFLKHIVSLSPRLRVRFLSPGEDPELDDQLDASLLPATGVGGPVPRMIFHGIPGGKEITAFAAAILNAGGGAKGLNWFVKKDIERLSAPMVVQVCVSLACHHCSQLVIHAQRIAWENPMVTAHMIDASLYPELAAALRLERVPLTVVNGKQQFPGGKTMVELTALLRRSGS